LIRNKFMLKVHILIGLSKVRNLNSEGGYKILLH
jgi:hypothetical protein